MEGCGRRRDRWTNQPLCRAQHAVSSFGTNEKIAAPGVVQQSLATGCGHLAGPCSQLPAPGLQEAGWAAQQGWGLHGGQASARNGERGNGRDREQHVVEARPRGGDPGTACRKGRDQRPQHGKSHGHALLWWRPPRQPQQHHFLLARSINCFKDRGGI